MSDRQPQYSAYIDWYGHGWLSSGLGGWSAETAPSAGTGDTWEQDFTKPYRHAYSLRVVPGPSGDGNFVKLITVPADAEVTITTTVWKHPGGGGSGGTLTLTALNTQGTGSETDSTTVNDEWVDLSVTVSPAVDTVYAVSLSHSATVSGDHYWLGWSQARSDMDDVSCDVLMTRQVPDVVLGRDSSRDLGEIRSGEVSLELNNADFRYTPDESGTGLTGRITLGREVLLQAHLGGNTYTLYCGFIDSFSLAASLDEQSITYSCLDLIAKLSAIQVSTELHESIRTGDAVQEILKAANLHRPITPEEWSQAERYLPVIAGTDHGGTLLTWWSFTGDVKEGLDSILDAEGPPSLYTVNQSNQIVFWDRHHRVRPEHEAPTYTLNSCLPADPPDEYVMHGSSEISYGWDTMFNRVATSVSPASPDNAITTVWTDESPTRTITGRQTITAESDGFIDGIKPVPGYRVTSRNWANGYDTNVNVDIEPEEHDFVVEQGRVTVESFKSSGSQISITLVAENTATISGLSMRGRAVRTASEILEHDDTASQVYFATTKESEYDAGQASRHDAVDISLYLLELNSAPRPVATIVMKNHNLDYTLRMLGTDLSESFMVNSPQWNIDTEFTVEGMKHHAGQLGLDHELTIYAQQSKPYPFEINDFQFDIDGRGFDFGVFGKYAGPSFTFGVAGHGFGDGAFGVNADPDAPFILGTSVLDGTDGIWY